MKKTIKLLALLIATIILWAAIYYDRIIPMDIFSLLWFKQLGMMIIAILLVRFRYK